MVIFGQGREFGCGTGTNVLRSSPCRPREEGVGRRGVGRSLARLLGGGGGGVADPVAARRPPDRRCAARGEMPLRPASPRRPRR